MNTNAEGESSGFKESFETYADLAALQLERMRAARIQRAMMWNRAAARAWAARRRRERAGAAQNAK